MTVNSFQIDEALKLTPVAPDKIAELAREADVRLWLDLIDFTPDELESWLDGLEVEDMERQLCLEARDRAGFYPLKRVIFFVIPVLVRTETTGEVDYVAFLCKGNFLLTLHSRPVLNPQQLAVLDASDAWLPERSIAGLVSALMIDQSLDCLRRTADLRDAVTALEQRMVHDPDTVEAEEILEQRSTLVTLGSLVSDQLPSVQALSRTDKPVFRLGDEREYIDCALTNLRAADESLTWVDQRIGALLSAFQMNAQEKTNRRLNMLTILSAVFMPVTLLAGIWGMNFEIMPELTIPFAYPLALGFMVVVGAGMYLFFRKTGWLE